MDDVPVVPGNTDALCGFELKEIYAAASNATMDDEFYCRTDLAMLVVQAAVLERVLLVSRVSGMSWTRLLEWACEKSVELREAHAEHVRNKVRREPSAKESG